MYLEEPIIAKKDLSQDKQYLGYLPKYVRNDAAWARASKGTAFISVVICSLMSSTWWNIFLLRPVLTVGKRKKLLQRHKENKVGAFPPQHLFGQKCLHCQCGIGENIILQQEPTVSLCSKLWSQTLQQTFNNLNVESTINCVSAIMPKFFMSHNLFVKKNMISMVLILDFFKRKFWALVITLRSIACSDVSSSYLNIQDSSTVRIQLWKLRPSCYVWMKIWHDVSLRCFCSSVGLCRTSFARIYLCPIFSWRIRLIFSLLMYHSCLLR
jgi:hypothetical protein